MEFQTVRKAEDVLDRGALRRDGGPAAVPKPGSEQRVTLIGLRLVDRGYGVPLRHGALPETLDLRKDVPHPVAFLAAGPKLRLRPLVHALLGVSEALPI